MTICNTWRAEKADHVVSSMYFKNLEKYLKPLPKIIKRNLKEDINTEQLCNDEPTFLFLEKWQANDDYIQC